MCSAPNSILHLAQAAAFQTAEYSDQDTPTWVRMKSKSMHQFLHHPDYPMCPLAQSKYAAVLLPR